MSRKEFLSPKFPLWRGNTLRNVITIVELEVLCLCAIQFSHYLPTQDKRTKVTYAFWKGFFCCWGWGHVKTAKSLMFGNAMWNKSQLNNSVQGFGLKLEEVFEPPRIQKGGLGNLTQISRNQVSLVFMLDHNNYRIKANQAKHSYISLQRPSQPS